MFQFRYVPNKEIFIRRLPRPRLQLGSKFGDKRRFSGPKVRRLIQVLHIYVEGKPEYESFPSSPS